MRFIVYLVGAIVVALLAACGGNGEDGAPEGAVTLEPASGPPGTEVTISPKCNDPPLTVLWQGSSGGPLGIASPSDRSKRGLTEVPDVAPGIYTLTALCGAAELTGEATFQVTR